MRQDRAGHGEGAGRQRAQALPTVMGKRVKDWRTNLPAASAALVLASVVVALVLAWVL